LFGTVPLPGGTGEILSDTATGLVGGLVSAHTRRAFGVGSVNEGRIALDAFGNALGNALVRGAEEQRREREAAMQRASQRMQQRSDAQLAALDERVQQRLQQRTDAAMAALDERVQQRMQQRTDAAMATLEEHLRQRGMVQRDAASQRGQGWDAPIFRLFAQHDERWNRDVAAGIANRHRPLDERDSLVMEGRRRMERVMAGTPEQQAAMARDRSANRLILGQFKEAWTPQDAVPNGPWNTFATLLGLSNDAAFSTSGKWNLWTSGNFDGAALHYVTDGNDYWTARPYGQLLSHGEMRLGASSAGAGGTNSLGLGSGLLARITFFSAYEQLGDTDWGIDFRVSQDYELQAHGGLTRSMAWSPAAPGVQAEVAAAAHASAARLSVGVSGGSFETPMARIVPSIELQFNVGSLGAAARTNNQFFSTDWRTAGRLAASAVVGAGVTWNVEIQPNWQWVSNNAWWLRHVAPGGK
jgi:hypothetical protein